MNPELQKMWRKNATKIKLKRLRRVLSAPLEELVESATAESKNRHYLSVIHGYPVCFSELRELFMSPKLRRWEAESAEFMFRVWLATPSNAALHHEALNAFVRSYAERLESTKRSRDIWSQAINATAARFLRNNSEFYTGIYQDIGGLPVVSHAKSIAQLTSEIGDSVLWVREVVMMFAGLHTLSQLPTVRPEDITFGRGAKIVEKMNWRPELRHIRVTRKKDVRKSKTIENNLKDAGAAPFIVYAAYNMPAEGGGSFLEQVIFEPIKLTAQKERLIECLKMARHVHDVFSPRSLRAPRHLPLLGPEPLPFEPPTLPPEDVHLIREISTEKFGRPRKGVA